MRYLLVLFFSICCILSNVAIAQIQNDSIRIQKLIDHADGIMKSHPDSAKMLFDSAARLADDLNVPQLGMQALNILGSIYWQQGKLDSAGFQYRRLNKLSRSVKDTGYLITSYNNMGLVYSKVVSSDSTEYYFKEAIRLAALANLKMEKAVSQNELAVLYMSQGRNLEAIDLLLESTQTLSKGGDAFRLTQQYTSLGWMYHVLDDFEKSINYYRKALQANKENTKVDFTPVIYNNMGMTFQNLSKHMDSAKYYYTRALNLSMEDEASSVISPTINLGNLYYMENNHAEALRYYRIALSAEGIESHFRPHAAILINTGLANYGLANYDSAEHYLHRGLNIAKENTLLEFQQNAYHGLYQLDSARNRPASALEYYKKHEEIEDSLQHERLSEKIKQLEYEQELMTHEQENQNLAAMNQLNRQTIRNQMLLLISAIVVLLLAVAANFLLSRSRKKQKELNQLLEQKNRDIENKKQELEHLNNTKDKLFAIVAHDLRNPFDALLGLLSELDQNYDDYDEHFRKEIIRNLHESSTNAYKLLVDLLEWSRTQRGNLESMPVNFNIREIMHEVYNNSLAGARAKSIQIDLLSENEHRVYADPQFVSSILTNLLNNAIKFTPNGGRVVVRTKEEKDKLKITVEDNGIGIPQDKTNELFEAGSDFQRQGTANEAGTGLGLVMCMEYVRMMDENIWVHSEEGKGSEFGFTVPLA